MSLNITQVEDIIRDWAVSVSSREVIWENYNGNRPRSPFISLHTQSVVNVHNDSVGGSTDAQGNVNIIGHREINVRVTVRGSSDILSERPLQIAHNLYNSLSKPSWQAHFRDLFMAIGDRKTPTSNPQLEGGVNWEQGASLEVMFRVGFVDSDLVGFFDDVIIEDNVIDFG